MSKHRIICVALIILFSVIYCTPVESKTIWVNDHEILDYGHNEKQSLNIFGIILHKEAA